MPVHLWDNDFRFEEVVTIRTIGNGLKTFIGHFELNHDSRPNLAVGSEVPHSKLIEHRLFLLILLFKVLPLVVQKGL